MVKVRARAQEAREKLHKASLPIDEGKVEVLRQALALAAREHAVKREELRLKQAQKQTEVEASRTQLANLELERQQAVIRAPLDGVVTSGQVKVGDVLERGKVAVEVAGRNGLLFEAVVPSEEVGHLKVGMRAQVKLDAFDYQQYGTAEGVVCFLSPDSSVPQGQRPATYLVKVELAGHEVGRGDLRGRVKLGMAGRVEIVTGRKSVLAILLQKIRQSISLG
jgi:multidrug resistance efflux pump